MEKNKSVNEFSDILKWDGNETTSMEEIKVAKELDKILKRNGFEVKKAVKDSDGKIALFLETILTDKESWKIRFNLCNSNYEFLFGCVKKAISNVEESWKKDVLEKLLSSLESSELCEKVYIGDFERSKRQISLEQLENPNNYVLSNYEDNSTIPVYDKDINGLAWRVRFENDELFNEVLNRCDFDSLTLWEDSTDRLYFSYDVTLAIYKDESVKLYVNQYLNSDGADFLEYDEEGEVINSGYPGEAFRDGDTICLSEAESKALMKGISNYLKEHGNQVNLPVFTETDEHGIKKFYDALMKQVEKKEKSNNDIER